MPVDTQAMRALRLHISLSIYLRIFDTLYRNGVKGIHSVRGTSVIAS
ncbi:hypothetical protein BN2476_550012 [Paraburkholderia piptadeniae]|uniref:Uncharacterized protein n=1 Tax=Paraburkholderia piptadeniae TaxID=1701573 RepID=A0A1N7SI74_9BURK|nr:hypothetical protein [Paraburkholderia piptadeniae]SIT47087.1 hypothetical protein BN2476_550012 [Paraburkholderia piptadeniae]